MSLATKESVALSQYIRGESASIATGGGAPTHDQSGGTVTASGTSDTRTQADWMAILSGNIVSAKDPQFGAVGDGTTDDTEALQAFLDYLGVAGRGKGVIPPGVYKITDTLTFDSDGDLTFHQIDCFGARLAPDNSVVTEALVVTGQKCVIRGLSVIASATGVAAGAFVSESGTQIYFEYCYVLLTNSTGSTYNYKAFTYRQVDKDTIGGLGGVFNCEARATPTQMRAAVWIEGVQNGLCIQNNSFVRCESHIYITHPPQASSGGDTYYGYIVNGMVITGNVSDLGDKWLEVVGRSGVAKSRWGMVEINNNRVESVTTFIDLTGEDQQPTDRTPPQIYGNALVTVTNEIVNPNNITVWGLPVSFTPTLLFGGVAVGMTGSFTGEWCRSVTGVVTGSIRIVLTAKGSSTGTVTVRAMPYDAGFDYTFPLWGTVLASGVGDTYLSAMMPSGGKIINLYKQASGSASNLTEADIADTTSLRLSFSYTV